MKFISLVSGLLLIVLSSFYYFSNIDTSKESTPGMALEVYSGANRLVTRDNYSFEAPENWIDNQIDFEGCLWDSISNPSNGHRMAGEVGIYPVSCFDLSKASGVTEFTEKAGYYITASYDKDSRITEEETIATKQAYKKVIDTFISKL